MWTTPLKASSAAAETMDEPVPINLGGGVEIAIRDLVTKIAAACDFAGRIVWDASKPDGQPRRRAGHLAGEGALGLGAEAGFRCRPRRHGRLVAIAGRRAEADADSQDGRFGGGGSRVARARTCPTLLERSPTPSPPSAMIWRAVGRLPVRGRRHSGSRAPWPRMNFRVPAGPSKITVPTDRGPVPLMPASVPVP